MGYVITPAGVSVKTDRIPGGQSKFYASVVADCLDEKRTSEYRASCITLVGDVGMLGGVSDGIISSLKPLSRSEDVLLRDAAKYALGKLIANA